LALMLLIAFSALGQKVPPKTKGKAANILAPEPLSLKAGDPLSVRALVARPPVLKGVSAWSFETRKHRSSFSATALSPDGKLYATGGIDGTIRIWEVESAKLVRALIGHNSYCYGLAFSPDGTMLASGGSYDATVRIWEVKTGMPLRTLKGHPSYCVQVAWSPDSKQVVSAGGESGILSYWDIQSGKHLGKTDLGRPVRGLAWHPEGRRVAVAAPMLAVAIWEIDQNKVVESFGDTNSDFYSVAWSPDGKTLAAGAANYTYFFDETGKELRKVEGQGYAVAWTGTGKTLATSDTKAAKIHLWDASSGAKTKSFDTTSYTIVFRNDDQQIVASGYYAYGLIECSTGKLTASFTIAGTDPPLWWTNRPIVTGVGTAKLSLWDATSGRFLRSLEGHKSTIAAVAWIPDGKTLVTASYDKTVKLWDVSTGNETRTLDGHTSPVLAVAVSNDGKLIASGGQSKLVLVHDTTTGAVVQTLKGHNEQINALSWAPGSDGLLVSGSSDKVAKLWNPKAGAKEVRSLVEDAAIVVSVGWSPDGKIVITGHDDHRARTWQTATGKLLHTLEVAGSPPQVSSLAWSPNDQMLASGRGNHTLQIWNTRTAGLIHSVQTMAPVIRVSWTPGSTTIIASNADRTARFFDAASGQIRATLLAEDKQLIAVSADGHYRSDGTITNEMFVVAQLEKSQETMSLAQFSAKFHHKNVASKVVLAGK